MRELEFRSVTAARLRLLAQPSGRETLLPGRQVDCNSIAREPLRDHRMPERRGGEEASARVGNRLRLVQRLAVGNRRVENGEGAAPLDLYAPRPLRGREPPDAPPVPRRASWIRRPPVDRDGGDVELPSQGDLGRVLIDEQHGAGVQLAALRFDPDRQLELRGPGERRAGHSRRRGKEPTQRHSGCGGNFATSSTVSGPRLTLRGSHVPGAWRCTAPATSPASFAGRPAISTMTSPSRTPLASAMLPFSTRRIRTPSAACSRYTPNRGRGSAAATGAARPNTASAYPATSSLQSAPRSQGSNVATSVWPRSLSWCGTPWP